MDNNHECSGYRGGGGGGNWSIHVCQKTHIGKVQLIFGQSASHVYRSLFLCICRYSRDTGKKYFSANFVWVFGEYLKVRVGKN
jgi:hypothetical protein